MINFLWSVCKGFLPTTHALALKHVNIDVRCPWCHSDVKTDNHVLFSCDFTKTVWLNVGMHVFVQTLIQETAFMVISRTFDMCTNGDR